MIQTQRAAFIVAGCFCAVLLGPLPSTGQYVSEYKNEAGAVTHLHYTGGSDWLVAQTDPRSHWHKLPDLTVVTFNNMAVSREALSYVLSLEQLRGLELGIGPEGIEIETKDLELLGNADHLDHLGLCLAAISNDPLRFLPKMEGLESLDVPSSWPGQEPRFTDEVAHLLVATPKLRQIRIFSDGFTDEFVRILSAKRDLESLEVQSRHLTDASLALIGNLPTMRALQIRSPLITDEGVRNLRDLATLEKLGIESPKLGSGALSIVSGLGRLSYLELSLDSVRTHDLASVQAAFDQGHLHAMAGQSVRPPCASPRRTTSVATS